MDKGTVTGRWKLPLKYRGRWTKVQVQVEDGQHVENTGVGDSSNTTQIVDPSAQIHRDTY